MFKIDGKVKVKAEFADLDHPYHKLLNREGSSKFSSTIYKLALEGTPLTVTRLDCPWSTPSNYQCSTSRGIGISPKQAHWAEFPSYILQSLENVVRRT